MENINISKVCGLCAGCRLAISGALDALQTHKKVTLFKEIVHNKNVNKMLFDHGIGIENKLENLDTSQFVILRAHGEPPETYEFLNSHGIEFKDCTCPKVQKIHGQVQKYSSEGYDIVIIGKYGKSNGIMHPEIQGTIGFSKTNTILIEEDDDLKKFDNIKSKKLYLVCQTTFNESKADLLIKKIDEICKIQNIELVIQKSICDAQKLINKYSADLAKKSDIMIVVGGKNSSNTKELYENLKKITKTIFLEDIYEFKNELKKNDITLTENLKIGITAGASTDYSELEILKKLLKKEIKEINNGI